MDGIAIGNYMLLKSDQERGLKWFSQISTDQIIAAVDSKVVNVSNEKDTHIIDSYIFFGSEAVLKFIA